MQASRTPGLTLVVLAAACRGELQPQVDSVGADEPVGSASGTAPIAPAVRTENGVRVIEHDADALDRAPRVAIEEQPVASLGGDDAEYDLTHANTVILLPDGRVATFAAIGNRLQIFRRDGRGERIIGRAGQAPGEFMRPAGMVRLNGDTLFLPDIANRRLNWVRPDEGVVASRPFDDFGTFWASSLPGALPDGRVVIHTADWQQEGGLRDTIIRPPAQVGLVNPTNDTLAVIAEVPGRETVMIEMRHGGRPRLGSTALRLGLRAEIATWDSLIVTATSPGFEIDLRRATGEIVAQLRIPRSRRPITAQMREAVIAERLERPSGGAGERPIDPPESRRIARESPFADSLPPLAALFSTPGGLLWVVDPIAPTDTAWSATAFRHDGAIVGRLHVSGVSEAVAFGDDRVVLRTRDENHVVTMHVHRLRMP